MRMCVLVLSLMSLFGAVSSSAGAVTWTNTGDTAFTATSGGSSFKVTNTELACTGADATGTMAASPFSGVIWSAASGTMTFTGCKLNNINTGIHCGYTFTTVAWVAGPPAVASGNLDATCSVYQGGATVCKIEGIRPGHYVNPSGTTGLLILTHSTALRTTNGPVGTCPLNAGEPLTWSTQTFKITTATGGPVPHTGPVITRHP